MTEFDTVYGVDFAVAKTDADRKVWVAEGRVEDGELRITRLQCARDFFGSGPDADDGPRGRDETLEALWRGIAGVDGDGRQADPDIADDAAWGLDFPFAVPGSIIENHDEWDAFVAEFPASVGLGDDDASPDGLRDRATAAGETARAVDAGGAKPAAGWLMKYLTYHGIERVLKPLVADGSATVVPMQSVGEHGDAGPVVMEVYPGGTLGELSCEFDGAVNRNYKGTTDADLRNRRNNLDALAEAGVEFGDDGDDCSLHERAAHDDDALDAVVAAFATWRNTRSDADFDAPADYDPNGEHAIEGYIYS
ncbi:DUF429 domain-containing protein [Halobium salinum]|uniref:DUF429 domain-containing protein n=1 Tax=Halobium salinum TaxID=1364940 RepID=A0ABD5PH85_9EURY|nr:DUF429 domain-containing protein [Halobium salinum]